MEPPFHLSDSGSKEDALEFTRTFRTFCKTVMEKMEEAYGVTGGLPAVVEGDRGIYELETMPVAPLCRRDDGSTMKQYLYGPGYEASKTSRTKSASTDEQNGTNMYEVTNVSNKHTCDRCRRKFDSRNRLFAHLRLVRRTK